MTWDLELSHLLCNIFLLSMWFYDADLKHFRKGKRDKDGQEREEEQESYTSDMGSLFNRIKANNINYSYILFQHSWWLKA